ncbi:MAG: hypothetical protein IPQ13_09510 [Holophagaceae bacterium]|nr:hypothetical protein [Holophagaceae bacterium]
MLKIAVIGAQTLLGRELVAALEPQDCSVLPLSTGPMTKQDEEGDLVVFAPEPALIQDLDVVILADTPVAQDLFAGYPGRILDLRPEADPKESGEPMPLTGDWPVGTLRFRGRSALEQVLARLPQLVDGIGEVSGTHLRSIAHLGDLGLGGLMEQTAAVIRGEEPDTHTLGYRAAFELVPQTPRGNLVEVRTPTFHGDLLVLNLRAAEGKRLAPKAPPEGVAWVDQPPTSRDVAVSINLLAHLSLSPDANQGMLTLGFDPILWGTLRPTLRLLGL